MKIIYILILVFISNSTLGQTIKGNITSTEGGALSNISVILEGTNIGTRTAENGDFSLRGIMPGIYTLVVSGIGYSVTRKRLVAVSGRNDFISLELGLTTWRLSDVLINSRRNRERDKASNIAAKIRLSNIENPQVINIVSNQIIKEQAATDFSSMIKNIPGVVKGWSSVNAYYSTRGFNTRNYIRNGVIGYVTADIDIANVDQMAAIKGPSGTLFGGTLVSFGGLLNRITKKPFDSTYVELGFQGGAFDLSRFTADINSPLNKDKTVLLRVNAARHYEGSFQDAGFLRSTFIAPSLFFKASERLNFSIDVEFYNREGTSLPQIIPVGPKQARSSRVWATNPSELPLDYKRSYSNNSIRLKNPNRGFYSQVDYKLSNHWASQINLIRTSAGNTGHYLTFSLLNGDSSLVRNVSAYPTGVTTVSQIQQNFIGSFRLGKLRNRMVIGLEFYQNVSSSSTNALSGRGGRRSFDTLNIKHSMPSYELISPSNIENRLTGLTATLSFSSLSTYAIYASDVLNITDRLAALLSLRIDRFNKRVTTNQSTNITNNNYNQTAFAPKFGLVYQLVKDRISLFVNYNNGFQNVASLTQPDGSVSDFKPQYANQFEGGIKADFARELFSAAVSYYKISVENTLRPEVSRPTFTTQDGTQFSKGLEIDLYSKPVAGLLFNAGYSFNASQLTSADVVVNDLRPVNSGPDKTVNFYVSYSLPFYRLRGLGGGIGGNYVSRNLIVNNTTNGQFYLNSYTLLNAAIFYNNFRYRFGINVDNLMNKQYYNGGFGTITPGMLRRFMTSLIIKF